MKARRFGVSEAQRLGGSDGGLGGQEEIESRRHGGSEASRCACACASWWLLGCFQGSPGKTPLQFGQHKDAKDVPGRPRAPQEHPWRPNCSSVSRSGAFEVLKNTATTNTSTEEQQITKHHCSLASTRMPQTSQEAQGSSGTPLADQTVVVFRVLGLSKF